MNKKKTKKVKKSVIVVLATVCFVVFAGYTFIEQGIKKSSLNAEINLIEEPIAAEKSEQNALAEEKKMVGTDEYKERYARSVLGYAAPGEIVFVDPTYGN